MKQFLPIILICFFGLNVNAQWSALSTQNNDVTTESTGTTKNGLVTLVDANNNTFVAWTDSRNAATTGTDIYIQKIDAFGNRVYTNDIVVCNAVNNQSSINLIDDGNDGVIVIWLDNRISTGSADIYMQKINSTGTAAWAANGIVGVGNTDNQLSNFSVKLNSTDFAITWRQNVGGSSTTGIDIFSNKYDIASGNKLLTNDVAIVAVGGTQSLHQVMADGSNGFFCVWTDARSGTGAASSNDIMAQRVNNDGSLAWAITGVEVSNQAVGVNLTNSQLISDNNGGIIISWTDNREATANTGIYAQRLNGSGVKLWANDAIVCAAAGNQAGSQLVADGSGNAIIVWEDSRTTATTNRDIYAQKVNNDGSTAWSVNGVVVCNAVGNQNNGGVIRIVTDNAGGAVICWDDARSGGTPATIDVYAERISATGNALWNTTTSTGIPLSNVANSNQSLPVLAPRNGSQSFVAVYLDNENNTTAGNSISAQWFNSGGLLPITYSNLSAQRVNNYNQVNWTISCCNEISNYIIEKSTNATNFAPIGIVTGNSSSNYSYHDYNPSLGMNYYRIKATAKNGETKYSEVVAVRYNNISRVVSIYPNPVQTSAIIHLQNFAKGNYTLRLLNPQGKQVSTQYITIHQPSIYITIPMQQLAVGQYILSVSNAKGMLQYSSVVVKQ